MPVLAWHTHTHIYVYIYIRIIIYILIYWTYCSLTYDIHLSQMGVVPILTPTWGTHRGWANNLRSTGLGKLQRRDLAEVVLEYCRRWRIEFSQDGLGWSTMFWGDNLCRVGLPTSPWYVSITWLWGSGGRPLAFRKRCTVFFFCRCAALDGERSPDPSGFLLCSLRQEQHCAFALAALPRGCAATISFRGSFVLAFELLWWWLRLLLFEEYCERAWDFVPWSRWAGSVASRHSSSSEVWIGRCCMGSCQKDRP